MNHVILIIKTVRSVGRLVDCSVDFFSSFLDERVKFNFLQVYLKKTEFKTVDDRVKWKKRIETKYKNFKVTKKKIVFIDPTYRI